MTDLADVLAKSAALDWFVGKVSVVTGSTITVSLRGGLIYNVGCMDQYIPAAGDIVICLSMPGRGIVALGSNNAGTPPVTLPTPTVLTVSAASTGTHGPSAGVWAASTLIQEPDRAGCFFYAAGAFTTMSTAALATFEIEVTCTAGGGPDFILHNNVTGAGPLVLADTMIFSAEPTTLSTPVWVKLPVGWGEKIVQGSAQGIGIGLGSRSGTYSGTGRLRVTTI